ncbi:MAG: YaeQ family protein [Sandaracinaceae bacterium]|nr:YaeQ family protein [Sandaracinaceae bacterium]
MRGWRSATRCTASGSSSRTSRAAPTRAWICAWRGIRPRARGACSRGCSPTPSSTRRASTSAAGSARRRTLPCGSRDLRGDLRAWIEVGQPSAERLHRASKLGARVVVYAYGDPGALLRDLERGNVHRKEELVVWELPGPLLDALEAGLDRNERWTLTVTDDALYLTRGEATLEGRRVRHVLA